MANLQCGAILIETHMFFSAKLSYNLGSMLQVERVFFALCSLTLVDQVLVCLAQCRMGPVDKSNICKMGLTCLHDFYGSEMSRNSFAARKKSFAHFMNNNNRIQYNNKMSPYC